MAGAGLGRSAAMHVWVHHFRGSPLMEYVTPPRAALQWAQIMAIPLPARLEGGLHGSLRIRLADQDELAANTGIADGPLFERDSLLSQ